MGSTKRSSNKQKAYQWNEKLEPQLCCCREWTFRSEMSVLDQLNRIPKMPASSKVERDCSSQIKYSKLYDDNRKQHNVLYSEQEKRASIIHHQQLKQLNRCSFSGSVVSTIVRLYPSHAASKPNLPPKPMHPISGPT